MEGQASASVGGNGGVARGICLAIVTASLRARAVTILQIVKSHLLRRSDGPNPVWRVTLPGSAL
jgi:hypothetical protein